MFTLEILFKDSDDQKNPPIKGKSVDWYITKEPGDAKGIAVLQGTSVTATSNGIISIVISDEDETSSTKLRILTQFR